MRIFCNMRILWDLPKAIYMVTLFCLYRVKLAPTKTTIGQVCSFVKGLQERTVVDVPGFCCLDAPYSSSDWGEKVRY